MKPFKTFIPNFYLNYTQGTEDGSQRKIVFFPKSKLLIFRLLVPKLINFRNLSKFSIRKVAEIKSNAEQTRDTKRIYDDDETYVYTGYIHDTISHPTDQTDRNKIVFTRAHTIEVSCTVSRNFESLNIQVFRYIMLIRRETKQREIHK